MALLLHIETATQVCSLALSDRGRPVQVRESREKNIHSSIITVFIDEMMKAAGIDYSALDAVTVSKGPGSYTGLRIGVSTAKGICYGTGKPLIAVGTLESMAVGMLGAIAHIRQELPREKILLCPMIDARRMEVYSELFDEDLNIVRSIQAEIISGESFRELLNEQIIVFAGDGAEKCREVLGNRPNARFLPGFIPSAVNMVKLAEEKFIREEFEDVAYFEPFYLKDFIPGIPKVKGLRIKD